MNLRQCVKEFNSSGPNNPDRHYTLPRPILMAKGKELVYKERYFTLFAPRQSGKSTFFMMLGEQLKTEGYKSFTNFPIQVGTVGCKTVSP
jgi:hypothetical protein